MAYITSANLKTYLGITGSGDDALIAILVANAQKAVDTFCSRTFEASSNATRYFTVGVDTKGRDLFLDEDLAAINTVTTNADAASPTSLTQDTDYIALPRNITPYHTLRMLSSSDYTWDYTDDPEMGIEISGKWAYSETAPADIVQACYRLAGYYYRQKDAQVFDVTAIPDAGVITVPQGIPADVQRILMPYRKVVDL